MSDLLQLKNVKYTYGHANIAVLNLSLIHI